MYGDSTELERQLEPTPDLPRSQVHNIPISSYQLPYAPFLCSRVTLCFRRSGVSGSYIRGSRH